MKNNKLLFMLLALATIFFTGCHKEPIVPQQERHSIVILFENDVHCAIDGYPKIAGLRDAIADTAWAGLVSCGDFIQGNVFGALSHGQYIIDIMKTMRYDVIGLGNHEFDYYVSRQQELLSQLDAPVVCCNFYDLQGHRMYDAYTLRTFGDHRVAFVGVLTPYTEIESEIYAFFGDTGQQLYTLHQDDYTELVQQAVDAARNDGADYVVLLSHLGETNGDYLFTSNDLIAATHGIDVVLDAHSHNVVDTVLTNSQGQPVLMANTGTEFANVGQLYIGADGHMDITLIPTEQIYEVSPTVNAAVEQVYQQVDAQTNMVVAHSEVPILITDGNGNRMVRKAETNAGDLTADAMRWQMGADIGLVNGGAIRVDLPVGDLHYGEIISLLPFDNMVWKIEATGAQILEVLRNGVSNLPEENGDFPQVSGLKFTTTVSNHSISDVEVLQADGSYAPLDLTATYTMGTADYSVTGGGFGGVLASCTILEQSTTLSRDVLVNYITSALNGSVGQQYAAPQGRINIQ
jgi:2',3'-cyclic-nucleotide 2'-phosphodiesterase (5'-nucleotidase family)